MKIKALFPSCLMGVVLLVSVDVYPLTVHFDFAKADLQVTNISEAKFDQIAREMKDYPYAKLEIDGYTDIIGPQRVNQKLSEARARAVRKRFVEYYGISPSRIIVRAFGEMRPEANNGTTEGRAWNRRAEAQVYRLQPADVGTDRPAL